MNYIRSLVKGVKVNLFLLGLASLCCWYVCIYILGYMGLNLISGLYAIFSWSKFIWGPLTCQWIRFLSFDRNSRYNRSLNCQNFCKISSKAVWTTVSADVVSMWLIYSVFIWCDIDMALTWQIDLENNKNYDPTCQLHKKKWWSSPAFLTPPLLPPFSLSCNWHVGSQFLLFSKSNYHISAISMPRQMKTKSN
jgi:hypothetical protein